MIFQKLYATQGNHIFANGTKAVFNEDGLYETKKESEIKELQAEEELYAVIPDLVIKAAPVNHDKLAKAVTGLQTTATAAV